MYDTPPNKSVSTSSKMENKDVGFMTFLFAIFPTSLYYHLHLMGHSDISVTMNVYTHVNFDDAEEELRRMEEFRKAQAEIEKKNPPKPTSQVLFKVI